jgi:hypothetical protein
MRIGNANATFVTLWGLVFASLLLTGCGPNKKEVQRIAAVACAQIEASREFESAMRVGLINEAREKIGGEPFLSGDQEIKSAVSYGLCIELVLGDDKYQAALSIVLIKLAKLEAERAKLKAEADAKRAKLNAEQDAKRAERRARMIEIHGGQPQCTAWTGRENMSGYSTDDGYFRLIVRTQEGLRNLGFEVGEVNGNLNDLTKRAIRQYQEYAGQNVSGLASNNLLTNMEKTFKLVCL